MPVPFLERLRSGILIGDGAMGTELFARGLKRGEPPELWNFHHPEIVQDVHRAYVEAGCDVIQTNTFGANRFRLRRSGLEGQALWLNRLGAELARAVCPKGCFVAGSIGPTGEKGVKSQERYEAFWEQAQALTEGGADLLLIETMTDIEEACLAVSAAKAMGLPVIASMVFKEGAEGYMTLGGTPLKEAVQRLIEGGADAIGTNCVDPRIAPGIIAEFRRVTNLPLITQPHAGLPKFQENKLIYPFTPERMLEIYQTLLQTGVNLVGGCCGTTPEHIAYLSGFVKSLFLLNPLPSPPP
ncbi:MAG: homocysteine S-methyltransferase family protein [Candidatus Methylomirabilales bacterium]